MSTISQVIEALAPCRTCDAMQVHSEKVALMLDQSLSKNRQLEKRLALYETELDKKCQQLQGLLLLLHLHENKHNQLAA